MAILDATAPADGDKAGEGASEIRSFKATFNSKLEGTVVEEIDAAWECVKGWPRGYYAANAAPPSPPANADQGRLWIVSDRYEIRGHDGTDWQTLSAPFDIRIPLHWGPGVRYTNAAYAQLPAGYRYVPTSGVWGAMNWTMGQGLSFNKALYPKGATVTFTAIGNADIAGQAKLEVWDVGAAAAVAGSEVTFATSIQEQTSGDFMAAIAAGARHLTVYAKAGTANWYDILAAELRIQKV